MRVIPLLTLSLGLVTASFAARFGLQHGGQIVKLSDPQISTDGKAIALLIERANYEDNRNDSELLLVEIGTRVLRTTLKSMPGQAVVVSADWGNQLIESNETNNTRSYLAY